MIIYILTLNFPPPSLNHTHQFKMTLKMSLFKQWFFQTPDSLRTTQIWHQTLDSLRTTQIQQRTPDSLWNTQFGSKHLIRCGQYSFDNEHLICSRKHNSAANTWFAADNTIGSLDSAESCNFSMNTHANSILAHTFSLYSYFGCIMFSRLQTHTFFCY